MAKGLTGIHHSGATTHSVKSEKRQKHPFSEAIITDVDDVEVKWAQGQHLNR